MDITRGATTVRSFSYDGVGDMLSDSRLGNVYGYTYNAANRLQLIQRVITNSGSARAGCCVGIRRRHE